MRVIGKQHNSRMCFVCGLDNPIGLRAQFYNMEDGSVMTPFSYGESCQSYPGRVHGGLVATMLDELGLRAMWARDSEEVLGVTMTMEVKLRRPVPYHEPLIGKGTVLKDSAKFATLRAEIFNRQGVLLAEAELKYLKLPAEQIAENASQHEEMCYLVQDEVCDISFEQ